jgi:predicted helicase
LNERKINLDDDYIKFIRFAEYLIEKNGEGVIGMITNNSYIDGITHRQMRKNLLETFDDIYIFDLHGNSKKKEKAPDGGKDENVFDIQQGVGISIFVKKSNKKKGLGKVHHSELYGLREYKYKVLDKNGIETIRWHKLDYKEPYYFFVPKDFGLEDEYKKGFKIDELFDKYGSGVITRNDEVTIQFDKKHMIDLVNDLRVLSESELRQKYNIIDGASWKLKSAKEDIIENENVNRVSEIQYRPFDFRYTLYTKKSGGFLNRPVFATMQHMMSKNISLNTARMIPPKQDWDRVLVSGMITDIHSASDQTYMFPLYLYSEGGTKVSNFNKEIYNKLIANIKVKVQPENVLDYIYAVLHSPSYREKYKEFLRIDFPYVPYPKNEKQFFALAKLGEELRHLHLMESPKVNKYITTYPEAGDDLVEKVKFEDGKVIINKNQYFGGVPEVVWNFYIGGYQPAQKWLKDRKGRKLTNEDIEHYQKMLVAIAETIKLMRDVDKFL